MKKLLVVLVLAFTAVAVTSPRAAFAQAGGSQSGGSQAPLDPAEYNSYVSAVQSTNVQEKIAGLEGFLQRYPNSTVKEAALEQLMAAYQQAGNAAKMFETADKLLQAFPNNLRGLAVMAYTKRAAAQQGQDAATNAAAAEEYGNRGLKALPAAPKPEGMSDADFQKLKSQYSLIFNGAVGFGELQKKNFSAAAEHLQAAVQQDPSSFYDVYQLGLADAQMSPMNPLGLFYLARAVVMSNNNADVNNVAVYYYTKYHGTKDDWDKVMAAAKESPTPPPAFTVAPAPSPAEIAKKLADSKDPKQLSFDELQLILVYGQQDVVGKVWGAVKGSTIPFVAQVIDANKSKLTLAATYEDIQNKQADVEVTMIAPIPAAMMPKVGDQIQIQGKPDTYTAKPFMVQMVDGQLIQAKKTPPAKKPPARRRKK
jgi:tetratricopeptide (TPR) repeat protein